MRQNLVEAESKQNGDNQKLMVILAFYVEDGDVAYI